MLEALRALDLTPRVHVAVDGTGSAAADDGSLDVGVGETADARWQYLNLIVRGESVDVPDSLAGDDCLGPQTDDWTDEVTP